MSDSVNISEVLSSLQSEFGNGVHVAYLEEPDSELLSGGEADAYTCKENTYLHEDDPLYQDQRVFNDVVSIVDDADIAKSWSWAPNTTHLVKVKVLETGDASCIAIEKLHEPPFHQPIRKKRETETRAKMDPQTLARSAARSKSRFVDKVMMIGAQFMLTGTTRDPVYDREEFEKMLSRFTKAFQKRYPRIKYCLVIEEHKSGALHWHMAAHCPKDYVPFKQLHRMWHSAITGQQPQTYERDETPGNVHVTKSGGGRQKWETVRLARYVGKYLAKDIENQKDLRAGKKRYWSTKGISRPLVARIFINAGDKDLNEILIAIIKKVSGKKIIRTTAIRNSAMVGHYMTTY